MHPLHRRTRRPRPAEPIAGWPGRRDRLGGGDALPPPAPRRQRPAPYRRPSPSAGLDPAPRAPPPTPRPRGQRGAGRPPASRRPTRDGRSQPHPRHDVRQLLGTDPPDVAELVDAAEPSVRGSPVEDALGQHRADPRQASRAVRESRCSGRPVRLVPSRWKPLPRRRGTARPDHDLLSVGESTSQVHRRQVHPRQRPAGGRRARRPPAPPPAGAPAPDAGPGPPRR